MNFGGWQPIPDGPANAPEQPGVLQARADALVEYPRGRSAMVLYAGSQAGESLRGYVAGRGADRLDRAAAAGARWIRFGTTDRPEPELDRLLRRFVERFGAAPAANQLPDTDQEARFPIA